MSQVLAEVLRLAANFAVRETLPLHLEVSLNFGTFGAEDQVHDAAFGLWITVAKTTVPPFAVRCVVDTAAAPSFADAATGTTKAVAVAAAIASPAMKTGR
jgi:hypothetical protein